MRALIGGVDLGEKRFEELVEKYGKDNFNKILKDLATITPKDV